MTSAPTRSRLRRWIKRTFLVLVGLIFAVVVAGTIWEAVAWRGTVAKYPPLGKLVDIGGRRLHLDCRGTGSPIVVLEAGLDVGGVIGWSLVHDSIASSTRTCAYNRAGIVWSDPSPAPHNAVTVTNDLHALLGAAGERGPYVMVGHSLGGPYIMTYTKYYGADVAGLVFVDASHPDQVERQSAVIGRKLEPPLGVIRVAAGLSWMGLVRAISRTVDMPKVPRERIAAMQGYLSRSLGQMLLEQESLDSIFAEAGTFRTLGDRPVVVLTAMAPMDSATRKLLGIDEATGRKFQATWNAMHDEEASWSTRSRHEQVPDATHYIQLDRPDVVIRAVREVVDSVRAR
jgi:pimeloyl-ACP methyl ester carboxylesterase